MVSQRGAKKGCQNTRKTRTMKPRGWTRYHPLHEDHEHKDPQDFPVNESRRKAIQAMDNLLEQHSDPWILIPLAAMFVIIFCCVFGPLKEMDIFRRPSKLAVALCVSILSVWGIDRTIIRLIMLEYNALGLTLLIALIVLLVTWILILRRRRGRRYRDVLRRE